MVKMDKTQNTKISLRDYLSKMINASGKTQRDIARELNYPNANIISMWKTGETRIPLDKIPDIAKALFIDPAHLFRLALEQYWPDRGEVIKRVFGNTCSTNEHLVLQAYRLATGDADPQASEDQMREMTEAFAKIFKVRH